MRDLIRFVEPRVEAAPPVAECDCSDGLLDEALQRVEALERSLDTGREEHAHMSRRLERLERQLGALLAARTESRDDLAGTQHTEHQRLSRQARTLVEQNFVNFARRYADKCQRAVKRPERERIPYVISLLSKQLFVPDPPSGRSIQRKLHLPENDGGHIEAAVTSLRGTCSELATSIHRAGLRHTWDFTHEVGTAIVPSKQEVWPACDPADRIAFAMSPAYVVDGRVYGRQYVYTV
ncbi:MULTISPECIES: hypothetical protein [unclassified Streptomyces]|uniref:hypothetical protein n=1 Tax=unclassified Streptomyces TaxID=2593676 RepID=UPI002E20CEAA|nr:hypothetical protein OG217_37405 [Streptomyces sp. NBC_01023]WSX47379.1 hypothetical protein OG760_37350 [Streptomyces sp. NBC_00963]